MKQILSALSVITLLSGAAAAAAPAHAQSKRVHVLKSAGCGCCNVWIKHLRRAGYRVTAKNTSHGVLGAIKKKYKIGDGIAACHTAKVGGYVIEGHVPVREIKRLLRERPNALGLTVPGMPVGSPGMENGTEREAYEVLLIRKDGSTEVYARYPARK